MQKLFSITILFTILSISSLYANNPLDSIGVENLNGKKVIVHKIASQETYYALGRKYNVSPKDIISFNNNKSLVPGIIVKIPTQITFASSTVNTPQISTSTQQHSVKAKENLSIIAKNYGTTVQEIKNLNNLTSNNLSIGQLLNIPSKTTDNSSPVASVSTPTTTEVVPTTPPASATNNTANTTPSNSSNATVPVVNRSLQSAEALEHTVKPREYLQKIAAEYHTTVEAIKAANNLRTNSLKIGQILKIPGRFDTESANNTPAAVSSHTVAAGETIFNIAQKYGLTAYQLREANNLENNTIKIGQILTVPGHALTNGIGEVANNAVETTFPDTIQTIQDPNMRRDPGVYGLNQVEEKGVAIWIDDPDLDSTKMLVLHRTLPIGTVIMVKNPMVNISTFAKVVGKFTENESTKDVIIVVTKAVADKLGVLDKRFFSNITYATQENEQ